MKFNCQIWIYGGLIHRLKESGANILDRRIIKTREAIQSAYMKLLLEKKTTKITVTEIARLANIDRKTFYLHYDSTEGIIREITERKMKEFLSILENHDFFQRPFNTHIYFQCLNQLLEHDIDMFQKIVNHPDFNYFWEQTETVMIQTLSEYLSKIVDLDKNMVTIYTIFVSSGINSVYTRWLKNEIPVSLDELGNLISKMPSFNIENVFPASHVCKNNCES